MKNPQDKKRLERRAKALLINKDIPVAKMDAVRSLMKNSSLGSEERYKAVIELVQNCPDKSYSTGRKVEIAPERANVKSKSKIIEEPAESASGPTETSYYIDELINKYRRLKLLKKRYLVHRENRFGIGFRKRLIPSQKLLNALKVVREHQYAAATQLNTVISDLLNDPETSEPFVYNFLKLFKRWLGEVPFVSNTFSALKWMERRQFEREFRNYAVIYFSFIMMSAEDKEKIYSSIEYRLRFAADAEGGYSTPRKASENTAAIGRYIAGLKSFLPMSLNEQSPLDNTLMTQYGINYFDMIMMIIEALCFMRPVSREEISDHYRIKPPEVNREKWDCSEELLKKAGKDPRSLLKRESEKLKIRLAEIELLNNTAAVTGDLPFLLIRSAEEQFKYSDKRNVDSSAVYEDNFLSFLESLVNYFSGTYLYFFSGGSVSLKMESGEIIPGSIFSNGWFSLYQPGLNSLLDDLHNFRTENPSLTLTRVEIKKIAEGRISKMTHAAFLIKRTGDFFYEIAADLCSLAKGVIDASSRISDSQQPVKRGDNYPDGAYPEIKFFSGCTVDEVPVQGIIMKRFHGMPIVSSRHQGALINEAASFCGQIARECYNEKIFSIINEYSAASARIDEIERTLNENGVTVRN